MPAQHYFMGGIHVDRDSKTTMNRLYAVGETSCNGVHGANRLASNSLLESLVFGERAASSIVKNWETENNSAEEFANLLQKTEACVCRQEKDLADTYKQEVLREIERERQAK